MHFIQIRLKGQEREPIKSFKIRLEHVFRKFSRIPFRPDIALNWTAEHVFSIIYVVSENVMAR